MERKKRRDLVLSVIAAAVLVYLVLYMIRIQFSKIDYERIVQGERPVFSLYRGGLRDGGTTFYQGFGYKITRQHRLSKGNGDIDGFDYGPILEYELNCLFGERQRRSDVRFYSGEKLRALKKGK